MDRGRPAVRVNQLGYLPPCPKGATWVTDAAEPAEFVLAAADGPAVFRGLSRPWAVRPEPTSGQSVHVLDFSPVTAPGRYRIEVGGHRSHWFRIGADLYDRLGQDALRVFYLLRSGCPIDEKRAPGYGRPAGHTGDTAVAAWSGPDAARLYPGWAPSGRFDVSGGWYDAGDYGKYTVSGGIALWQLLHLPSSIVEDECRWQLDWLLRMQVPAGQPLAGMAFHRVHGTQWSPMPGWAHEDPTERVLHRPSTAATLHLAAVAAQGARLLRSTDGDYATGCWPRPVPPTTPRTPIRI